jgi:hypothetical protein
MGVGKVMRRQSTIARGQRILKKEKDNKAFLFLTFALSFFIHSLVSFLVSFFKDRRSIAV